MSFFAKLGSDSSDNSDSEDESLRSGSEDEKPQRSNFLRGGDDSDDSDDDSSDEEEEMSDDDSDSDVGGGVRVDGVVSCARGRLLTVPGEQVLARRLVRRGLGR